MKKTLFAKAKQWLENQVDGKDKVLILPLPPQIIKSSLTIGEYVIDWPLLTNQQNTLYFE